MVYVQFQATGLPTLLLFLLSVTSTLALGDSGPNAGGVLILHSSSVPFTSDGDYCGQAGLDDCEGANVEAEPDTEVVAHVLAAFPSGSSPRLKGVTFGLDYPGHASVLAFGSCGDFEVSEGDWPMAGSGTAVTWSEAQTHQIVEIYWCGLYVEGGENALVELMPHPTQGGFFADDGTPAVLDPVASFGALGFSTGGELSCPEAAEACCFEDESCSLLTVASCESAGGTPQGEGTSCDPNPCRGPLGACCFADGSCVILPSGECNSQNGEYQGDEVTCDPNPCEKLTRGACCFPNGGCGEITPDSCAEQGGEYQGDNTICNPNPCPQPEGACCFEDGSCELLERSDCGTAGGVYYGDDVPCDPNPCPNSPEGACCFDDLRCRVLRSENCQTQGGSYVGDEVPCDPNPCPDPSGACCFPNEICLVLLLSECLDQEGDFQGEGVECDPLPCVDESGACCFADRTCLVLTQSECEATPGYFVGGNIPCEPDPCPDPGCPRGLTSEERVRILRDVPARRVSDGPSPTAETGVGKGVVIGPDEGRGCGSVVFNADGSYENGYTWQYGGVLAPEYGAFAEFYNADGDGVCGVILDLTQVGVANGQTADLYVWSSDDGVPGAVLGFEPAVDPGPIAFWPSISRHAFEMDSGCPDVDGFFVGYWGNWPGEPAAWYVAADIDGFGGCSMTNIAPGNGFPTGWQNVSLVWGPTQALGIGFELEKCFPSPVQDSSWGRIKSLFR